MRPKVWWGLAAQKGGVLGKEFGEGRIFLRRFFLSNERQHVGGKGNARSRNLGVTRRIAVQEVETWESILWTVSSDHGKK